MVTQIPSEPLAAYAMGMLRQLGKSATTREDATSEAVASSLDQAHGLLVDDAVARGSKERFVDMLEDAGSWSHVRLLIDGLATPSHEPPLEEKDAQANANAASAMTTATAAETTHMTAVAMEMKIPEVLSCAICCGDLMLKPATLPCGHSFCKGCVDLWLRSCPSCPTCRQAVRSSTGASATQIPVNLVLQELVTTLYPSQAQELAQRDHMERLERLHDLIAQCVDRQDGGRLQDVLTLERLRHGGSSQEQSVVVSMVLEQDNELRGRVLAAEIRERMRKERLLRESSRRRHVAAYAAVYAPNLERCSAAAAAVAVASGSQRRPTVAKSNGKKSTRIFAALLGRK